MDKKPINITIQGQRIIARYENTRVIFNPDHHEVHEPVFTMTRLQETLDPVICMSRTLKKFKETQITNSHLGLTNVGLEAFYYILQIYFNPKGVELRMPIVDFVNISKEKGVSLKKFVTLINRLQLDDDQYEQMIKLFLDDKGS